MDFPDRGVLVSVVVATKGRIDSLNRLLNSLCQVGATDTISYEVIVANNATDKSLARRVDDLVVQFSNRASCASHTVRVRNVGKAIATNAAIRVASGKILAFLDDDVAVCSGWLMAVAEFFRDSAFAAMQGTIILPPESENDPELQRLYNRYRTICLFPPRPGVQEIDTLTGANMAVRRDWLDKIGLFDVRLGPGQSGTSDDTELAERIIEAGGRIGCAPDAVVYHEVDWTRLSEEYFRLRHRQQGISRLIYKNPPFLAILYDLARSLGGYILYAVLDNERKKYRAKGRCFHYSAMLKAKFNRGLRERDKTRETRSGRPVRYPQRDLAMLDRKNL